MKASLGGFGGLLGFGNVFFYCFGGFIIVFLTFFFFLKGVVNVKAKRKHPLDPCAIVKRCLAM